MKLIWIEINILSSTMTLALTSCTLLPQSNSNSQPADENQIVETKPANSVTPISTEVSYTFQRENPLIVPPGLTV